MTMRTSTTANGTRRVRPAMKTAVLLNWTAIAATRLKYIPDLYCPDQTDSSNHVTLWDGSNYKRAA